MTEPTPIGTLEGVHATRIRLAQKITVHYILAFLVLLACPEYLLGGFVTIRTSISGPDAIIKRRILL